MSGRAAFRSRRFPELTFCQTKPFPVPFLAPKYAFVDSEALLRRFAKCRLSPISSWCFPSAMCKDETRFTCFLVNGNIPPFYYHPICWHGSPSSEWNLMFLRFIFQTFDFRGRNNIVWEVKQYCLTSQTQVFDAWNNIVWALKCKDFENEVYSFLKPIPLFRLFVCIHLSLRAGLPGFWKVCVMAKVPFCEICQAKVEVRLHSDKTDGPF